MLILVILVAPPKHPPLYMAPTVPAASPTLQTEQGGLKIGCGFDGALSAPEVCRGAAVVGVYLDDTTPNLRYWVQQAVAAFPHGIVLVAVAPGQAGVRYRPSPPVINLYEAYPFGAGVRPSAFFPLPRYPGYIMQWAYRTPTLRQRYWLLGRVLAKHPRYIFFY